MSSFLASLLATLLASLFLLTAPAEATVIPFPAVNGEPLSVMVTFPVLKDIVEQIGQDRIQVKSLLSGLESEHTYTPEPSDIVAIRRSQILFRIGLGLEVWVDDLVENAENPDLKIVTASRGIFLIEAGGDPGAHGVHGDPHIWLDPENVIQMTGTIVEELARTDPKNEFFYRKNQADYIIRLEALMNRIFEQFRPLKNRKIITHHGAWAYFARRFGLDIRGIIIPQVGTEPSAKHLAELVRLIREEKIGVIVSEPQLNPGLPKILAMETGAEVITLTPIPGALKDVPTYEAMIEYNARQLVRGLGKGSGE